MNRNFISLKFDTFENLQKLCEIHQKSSESAKITTIGQFLQILGRFEILSEFSSSVHTNFWVRP